MLIKHSVGLILINVLETCTSISERLNNMLWILKHDLFTFFCTELAKVILLYSNKRQIWNTASAWPNQWYSNFVHCLLIPLPSALYDYCPHLVAASRGDMGPFPSVGGSLPTPPSLRRKKMTKISYIRRICGFLTLRIAFCPLDAPPQEKQIWCRHWSHHLVD